MIILHSAKVSRSHGNVIYPQWIENCVGQVWIVFIEKIFSTKKCQSFSYD
jgi:hypothetical protein